MAPSFGGVFQARSRKLPAGDAFRVQGQADFLGESGFRV